MIKWLKKNWKLLLGAISTLGLSVLFAKTKESKKNKKLEKLADKKIEVVETAGQIETDGVRKAGETHTKSVKEAHAEKDQAIVQAEIKKEETKKRLIENPDDIDDKLSGFGISEKK